VDEEWSALDVPYRPPLAWPALVGFLGARAVPGVEEVVAGVFRRVLRLPGGPGLVEIAHPVDRAEGTVRCRLRLFEPADRPVAVAACRRLLDLDADPAAITDALGADAVLGAAVRDTPGRRSPGAADPDELAFRAVLGQQVTLAAARGLAGRLAALCGEPLPRPEGGLTTAFPSAAAVAEADLDRLGMPGSRRATLRALGAALAAGDIRLDRDSGDGNDDGDGTAIREAAQAALLGLKGVGPWTAAYIRMRALGDPDVFLPGDVGVRRALDVLGLAGRDRSGDRWRPWRSYAVHHLWASLG
jgi:AraC family transcriptional regulator, regulatory protein of adaptative response / DNA-3-methyladenine glycosylase II